MCKWRIALLAQNIQCFSKREREREKWWSTVKEKPEHQHESCMFNRTFLIVRSRASDRYITIITKTRCEDLNVHVYWVYWVGVNVDWASAHLNSTPTLNIHSVPQHMDLMAFLLSKNGLRYLLYPFMSFWMVGGRISPSFTSALSREFSRILQKEEKHEEREHTYSPAASHYFMTERWWTSFSRTDNRTVFRSLIIFKPEKREREAHLHNWITLIRQCEGLENVPSEFYRCFAFAQNSNFSSPSSGGLNPCLEIYSFTQSEFMMQCNTILYVVCVKHMWTGLRLKCAKVL